MKNFTKVTRNAARCKSCGDVIESNHRHDFVSCSCGAIYIDGGLEYCRGGGDLDKFESLSEEAPWSIADCNKEITRLYMLHDSGYYHSKKYYIDSLNELIDYRNTLEK